MRHAGAYLPAQSVDLLASPIIGAAEAPNSFDVFTDKLFAGGATMLVLVFLSVYATATAIERLAQFKKEILASGISMALITTAAGLLIAIPSMALSHYFKGRINGYALLIEQELTQLRRLWNHQKRNVYKGRAL